MQRRKIFKKFLRAFVVGLCMVQVLQINTAKGLDRSSKLDTSITVLTGTKPFDKKRDYLYPGEDYSYKDNYIRTLDTLKYSLQYTVNSLDEPIDNLIITANIPVDNNGNKIGTWDSNLKKITGVTIEDDGTKLTYKKKKTKLKESATLDFSIKISGNIKNGTKFKVPFNVKGDNIEPFTINTKEITVSALPKFDLINIDDANNGKIEALGPNGERGRLFIYGIGICTSTSKGSEALKGNISFCDDLSQFGIKNATLYTWGRKNEDNIKSCGINGDDANTIISSFPYGSLQLGFDDDRSVLESGEIIAKQKSPGKPINITIKNMDSSANHCPTKDVLGNVIKKEDKYVFSGYIVLWVDENNILLGENNIINKFYKFNAKSITDVLNNSNGSENLNNNTTSFKYIKRQKEAPRCTFDVSYIDSKDKTKKTNSINQWLSEDSIVTPSFIDYFKKDKSYFKAEPIINVKSTINDPKIDDLNINNDDLIKSMFPKNLSDKQQCTSNVAIEAVDCKIEKNKDINYVLSYSQKYNNEYQSVDIVDVLPFNGDERGSKYSGECFLKSIKASDEDEVYISYDDPKTINQNSKEGNFNWIPYEESIIKGEKVTAIKVHFKDLSTQEVERKVLVTLGTKDNSKEDVYVNSVEGVLGEVNKTIKSTNSSVKVYNKENCVLKENNQNLNGNNKEKLPCENKDNNKVNKLILKDLKKDNITKQKNIKSNLSFNDSVKERKNPIDNNISNGNITKSICEDKYEDKFIIENSVKVVKDNMIDKEYQSLFTNCCGKSYNNLLGSIVVLIGIVGLIICKKSKGKN
ncbi:hypothetical protein Z969_06790 [Clostridium novyi A str. 4570]|uniref:Uncharacterized protein n=1 Tax=Clostridium novyi A str. 4570 TaxID=1444290 RepID=A0AA88ZP16_CLONO|nr:hypothetical protein [Clostridium novyi]KGN02129.1 hypothetical protein Z969_06790 [Clostridium novyi A str. 4570]